MSKMISYFPDEGPCPDYCTRLYSSCHYVHGRVVSTEVVGNFCHQMQENPENFLNFLKNQSMKWTPFQDKRCLEGQKFCPLALAFKGDACIPDANNCTDIQGMLLEMVRDAGKEDGMNFFANYMPADNAHCPRSFMYSEISKACFSDGWFWLLDQLSMLMKINIPINPFNVSCPPYTKYCFGKSRCIPVDENCNIFKIPYSLLMPLPGMEKILSSGLCNSLPEHPFSSSRRGSSHSWSKRSYRVRNCWIADDCL